jgi:hypothetical protein
MARAARPPHCFASLALLALCLALGLAHAAASSASAPPLISPRFQFGLPNTTSNFTATAPVTWALLDRHNSKRVIGSVPGYAFVWVTDTFVEILAGERAGLFHLRALRNSCADADADAQGCVATVTWLVLSDAQMTALGLSVASATMLCAFAVVRRLQPGPESKEEKHQRSVGMGIVADYYGTFEGSVAGGAPGRGARGAGGGRGVAGEGGFVRPPPPRRHGPLAGDSL